MSHSFVCCIINENCREVSKGWKNCIENNKILWNTIIETKSCSEAFQLACKNGLSKLLEILLQKSNELEIDYNAKTIYKSSKVMYIKMAIPLCYRLSKNLIKNSKPLVWKFSGLKSIAWRLKYMFLEFIVSIEST